MNKKWIAVAAAGPIVFLGMSLTTDRPGAAEVASVERSVEFHLDTAKDKSSYGMGVALARSLKRQGVEINGDALAKGMRDGLAGEKLLVPEKELVETLSAVRGELKQKSSTARTGAENGKQHGEAFLAENAKKEGVVTLKSGLQYKILEAGEGTTPGENDFVECNYRGKLVDGTEFDSSYARGRPATFGVGRVIPGWQEALKLMPVGAKWQIFVPSRLAYGERGLHGPGKARGKIGPNATLIFEVELLSIKARAGANQSP